MGLGGQRNDPEDLLDAHEVPRKGKRPIFQAKKLVFATLVLKIPLGVRHIIIFCTKTMSLMPRILKTMFHALIGILVQYYVFFLSILPWAVLGSSLTRTGKNAFSFLPKVSHARKSRIQ